MTTDFRALCAELVESVEVLLEMRSPNAGRMWTTERRLRVARTALADEPAVPEGMEPVAVVQEPSDAELVGKLVEAANGAAAMGWDHHAQDAARKAASAVLARWGNPVPVPLTDGEVDCISIDEMCEILRSLGIKAAEHTDCTILYELTFEQLRAICDTRAFALSRRTPAAPADGEVAELMEGLRLISDGMSAIGHDSDSWFVARAAKLLQRQATACAICERERLHQSTRAADLEVERQAAPVPAGDSTLRDAARLALTTLHGWSNYDQWVWPISAMAQAKRNTTEAVAALEAALCRPVPAPADGEVAELVPVPVSERLPGPEDCDAEGRCWFLRFPFDYSRESWSLEDRTYGCNTGFTHWLPAHALPIPHQQENTNDH